MAGGQLRTAMGQTVLRDEEEVKEEEGLVTENRTKPGQSRAQLWKGVSIQPSEEGSSEEPGHHLGAWFGVLALPWALSAFFCETVLAILTSQSTYGKNGRQGCLAPWLACRRLSTHF